MDGKSPIGIVVRWYFLVLVFALINGCAGGQRQVQPDTVPETVPEIRPGILQGYLTRADQPDSLRLITPPPGENSAALAMDQEVSRNLLSLRGTSRWELAALDADLRFPQTAGTFACALNAPITEQDTPNLYMLLRRTLADAGLSTYGAKNKYQRARPFMVNGQPSCTPEDEAHLREDGSYPSGHSAIGWAWALILTEVAPEHATAILARGRAFSQSRAVCNVHWQTDVIEGRSMGAAAVARLHSNPLFLQAVAAAREEFKAVQAKGLAPQRDCAIEAAAIKIWPSPGAWPVNGL